MKKIALITSHKHQGLIDGDNKLIKPFNGRGINISAIPWDKPDVVWHNFDAVILRSCWDYIERKDEFTKWINKLEREKANLWNPFAIVRWNTDKNYLIDLENKGIRIISTKIFSKNSVDRISEYVNSLESHKEIIVKPIIGNESYMVKKLSIHNSSSTLETIYEMIEESDILIQPYLKEIETEGEYSFIFFDKKYSHSVIKKPKKNEFRAQLSLGGTEEKIIPTDSLINQAHKIINSIKSPLLYGRVDGINVKGKLLLMELELTEPYLFFEFDEKAAESFVEAVVKLIL